MEAVNEETSGSRNRSGSQGLTYPAKSAWFSLLFDNAQAGFQRIYYRGAAHEHPYVYSSDGWAMFSFYYRKCWLMLRARDQR